MIKKYLIIVFVILISQINITNTFAKKGSGEVILSNSVLTGLINYLNYKKGKGTYFILHESGKEFHWSYCPTQYSGQCIQELDRKLLKICKERAEKNNLSGNCYVFVKNRNIVWKNSSNKKRIKIPKKISDQDLKALLIKNNFLTEDINIPTFDTNNPDLVEKLKGLKKLYEDGALTKADFENAKKSVLGKN